MSDQRSSNGPSRKAFLPVMGLIFAALLIAIAYVLAPFALEGLGSIQDDWGRKIRVNEDPDGEFVQEYLYLMAGMLWLVLMGFSMVIVAAAAGQDPERESLQQMSASPANKKAMAKQLKRELRDAKRRARQQKK